jgi:hypothetical protein
MRTDLNFEAESVAGYYPSQNEGADQSMTRWRPGGFDRGRFRRRRRWPWLQTDPGFGAEYQRPFGQGETDFFYETGPAGSIHDQAFVAILIVRGERDENKLTNALFYERHPEWKGKALKNARRVLRAEWVNIRDGVVRPLLKSAKPPSTPISPTPAPTPPPIQPTNTATLPSGQQGAGILGYNSFDNIRKYQPAKYQAALEAQTAFQRVKGFLPWYRKIMNAVKAASIALGSDGIGNLVFSIEARAFTDLVRSRELVNKTLETIGSGLLGRLEFTVDFIGLLGLGATLLDIARGIENERMLSHTGVEADKWQYDQKLKFVISLLAEDLSRQDLRGSYFVYRNARDLVNEITADLAEFKPLNDAFVSYLLLEDQLARRARDWGSVPDVLPPEAPVMSPWPH